MKVLVTGGGGREHALAWRIAQSRAVEKVFVAPGNAGTELEEKLQNVSISPMDFDALIEFAQSEKVDLTVVGPEDPLVAGCVDRFAEAGLRCFGPSKSAAQLEGSKSFTKAFLKKYGIPTGDYRAFDEIEAANEYLDTQIPPIVIKADGLAAGKGVVIAQSIREAKSTVADMLSGNVLSGAGSRVVIEEFLEGEEASFIIIADGENFLPFATSQDHKAAYDGDTGPNTGGMGAYSPAPVVTPEVFSRTIDQVIKPTLQGMKDEGHPYTGFLYAGLMIDKEGRPRVIEYNCRFGDPETQPIMSRLQTELVSLMVAAIDGRLNETEISFDPRVALTVVMASGGYPGNYDDGKVISGLRDVEVAKVFHAGTTMKDGEVVTNGGRVLGVTALGSSALEANEKAYAAVNQISFNGAEFRTDIGYRAIARENV
ncbi:MAG: phosphoribosylamine--glycine ligase [Gammaproteobacteria bacterium]|jgi:phosphoribosylamine--glycine ligase|nr:phosphoribosylamine--glycine ligase [Gammaproteobacteria bacterium]MBT7721857.1 phosphoribosylamine--glycine ligase [Gammaproteobacteria bacterium]MBT7798240.1 phosphoribosylamine--glycine ligase [Gammaproteobacteria bacterium]